MTKVKKIEGYHSNKLHSNQGQTHKVKHCGESKSQHDIDSSYHTCCSYIEGINRKQKDVYNKHMRLMENK